MIHSKELKNSAETLPNQITEKKDKKESREKLMAENKEIKEYSCKLEIITEELTQKYENLNEEVKKMRGDMQTYHREDGWLVKVVFWLACLTFAGISVYYIGEGIKHYRSEPLMATVNLIPNKTFTWPTISIQPAHRCYNSSALKKLKKMHNVDLTNLLPNVQLMPFEIKDRTFNWSANNVSQMYLQSKYRPPLAKYVTRCWYRSSGINTTDCFDGKLGTWETYTTQYNVNEAFTPVPASSLQDEIALVMDASLYYDYSFKVAIHQSKDKFSNPHPSAKDFYVFRRSTVFIRIGVEEFHTISTRSSPCVEDVQYSQAQCFEAKLIEFKIQKAGCHFPGITGYQPQLGNFPECDNASSFEHFMYWHNELYYHEGKYDDLQKLKDQCGEPCHRKKYIVVDKSTTYNQWGSKVFIMMDSRAMSYQSVNERYAMTLDMLVSNVGGILGLFLGISCLTVINGIQYVIRKITMICAKKS